MLSSRVLFCQEPAAGARRRRPGGPAPSRGSLSPPNHQHLPYSTAPDQYPHFPGGIDLGEGEAGRAVLPGLPAQLLPVLLDNGFLHSAQSPADPRPLRSTTASGRGGSFPLSRRGWRGPPAPTHSHTAHGEGTKCEEREGESPGPVLTRRGPLQWWFSQVPRGIWEWLDYPGL